MPLPLALPLEMSVEQRSVLDEIARSSAREHREVRMARALLLAADGVGTNEIGRRVGVSAITIRSWRARFLTDGVAGVGRVAPGRGRRVSLERDLAERIVEATCTTRPPDGATHSSTRALALELGVSRETVRRIWRAYGLTPWRIDTFKLSRDPDFTAKLLDVVGLYLDPPQRAAVFAFDEKTPGTGTRPHATVIADTARTKPDPYPRLQAPRHA